MRPSSGRRIGLAVGVGGQADAPDPSDEERALRAIEWAVIAARRSAEADRRRRMRAVEIAIAEDELRTRRDAERRRRAVRAELARGREANDLPRPAATVDVAAIDLAAFRIVAL